MEFEISVKGKEVNKTAILLIATHSLLILIRINSFMGRYTGQMIIKLSILCEIVGITLDMV